MGFAGNPAVKFAFGSTTVGLTTGFSRKMLFLRAAFILYTRSGSSKPEDSGSKIAVVTS